MLIMWWLWKPVISRRAAPAVASLVGDDHCPVPAAWVTEGGEKSRDTLRTPKREQVGRLVEQRRTGYVLTVTENQPTLFAHLDTLPRPLCGPHSWANLGPGRVRAVHLEPIGDEINFLRPHALS
ncbi:MAG TPA: hypothetical protein VJT49_11235 [Amycolatopsis sp.]|uniref:hypothetical protein n=1 Tax=Amycolatopsis sp. TaxID=37632 RepID=UPI002B45ABB7|nr:hypothetical protein [Amycolatopsis sp.]HKS45663.1 hypothetical protein [Amycolatopsis sp.]